MRGPRSGSAWFRFIYEDPVIAFLLGVLVSGHLPAAIGLVLFFLHTLFAAGAGMTRASLADMAAARRSFFDRPTNLRLHPVALHSVAPRHVLKEVKFRPSFARPMFRGVFKLPVVPIRAFWVEVLQFPAPTEWRAYAGTLTTQFIFILERPSRMSAYNRFRLFHELHHVSVAGVAATWQRHVLPRIAPVSAIGVLIAVGLQDRVKSIGVVAALLVWLGWEFTFANVVKQLVAEVKADEFAVLRLPSAERADVIRMCGRLWISGSRNKTAGLIRRAEWHLRLARMADVAADADARSGDAPSTVSSPAFRPTAAGRIGLGVVISTILIFGPLLNIVFFFLGTTVQPQSLTYLLFALGATIFQRVHVATLLSRATKEFATLEGILVERGLAI